jgi:hypothetical protein
MQYILLALVYFGDYHYCIIMIIQRRGIWEGFMFSGSREQKGVRLYGKYDYYLICTENLVRSCGAIIKVYCRGDGLTDHEQSLWVRDWLLRSGCQTREHTLQVRVLLRIVPWCVEH